MEERKHPTPERGATSTLRRMQLDSTEARRLRQGCPRLCLPTVARPDTEGFVFEARSWFQDAAPKRLREALLRWSVEADAPGLLLVDGWGSEPDLPPTPTDPGRTHQKASNFSETLLVGVAGLIGEPIGFEAEGGRLVTDLTAVRGQVDALTNEGAVGLDWHNEHAATGLRLEPYAQPISDLLFFSLRDDPRGRAKTLVADVRDAQRLLDEEDIAILHEPRFHLRLPYLLRAASSEAPPRSAPRPILTGPAHAPQISCALYGDLTSATDSRAALALAALKQALSRVRYELDAPPGRLVLLDNRKTVHARAPYVPRFDGTDRWIQRTLVTRDLPGLRPWQQSGPRVLRC